MALLPQPAASLAFLTFHSALAAYWVSGDAAALTLVVSCYAFQLLLFLALHRYEAAPPGDIAAATEVARKVAVRTVVWLQSALLLLAFRALSVPPLGFSVVVWVVSAVGVGAGLHLLFSLRRGGRTQRTRRRTVRIEDYD